MIETIKDAIQSKLGVDCSKAELTTCLGETGVGLDSQELIEFSCVIEKQFGVKLPQQSLTKTTTLENVIHRVQNAHKTEKQDSSLFEGKTESVLDINCSVKEAYAAIYEMEKWPLKLPHVKKIETLYNDGVYQEFLMDVLSEKGLIKVRSIRRCIEGEGISFFQPTPPVFLKHHCGGWSFSPRGNQCQIRTWHQWNLNRAKATELFPPKPELSTQDQIAQTLRSHAELALSTWKTILEGTQ